MGCIGSLRWSELEKYQGVPFLGESGLMGYECPK